jgi:hypothetical protein
VGTEFETRIKLRKSRKSIASPTIIIAGVCIRHQLDYAFECWTLDTVPVSSLRRCGPSRGDQLTKPDRNHVFKILRSGWTASSMTTNRIPDLLHSFTPCRPTHIMKFSGRSNLRSSQRRHYALRSCGSAASLGMGAKSSCWPETK